MIVSIQIEDQTYEIDTANPLDISIPLKFNGKQPNSYDVEKATSTPCKAGELVGDTRLGGSCNFEQYTFIPHCNGTHTECVGHITHERISVRECLQDAFISASLITVEPKNSNETDDTYPIELDETDKLITKNSIEKALENSKFKIQNSKSLIIRTLPNDESKLTRRYMENLPPFFSTEAIEFVVELGIKHLLVDTPSIDRTFDEGKLSNHRIFWKIEQGSFELNEKSRIQNTITEMIYVPDAFEDGSYLLNLQVTAFETDASPSRPVLFKISQSL